MDANSRNHQFPLWQYLNQPLFHPTIKLELNPQRFWRTHRIEHLRRCWEREFIQKQNPQNPQS